MMMTEDKDKGSKKIRVVDGGERTLAEKKKTQTNS